MKMRTGRRWVALHPPYAAFITRETCGRVPNPVRQERILAALRLFELSAFDDSTEFAEV